MHGPAGPWGGGWGGGIPPIQSMIPSMGYLSVVMASSPLQKASQLEPRAGRFYQDHVGQFIIWVEPDRELGPSCGSHDILALRRLRITKGTLLVRVEDSPSSRLWVEDVEPAQPQTGLPGPRRSRVKSNIRIGRPLEEITVTFPLSFQPSTKMNTHYQLFHEGCQAR
jgi:hypothetical protein